MTAKEWKAIVVKQCEESGTFRPAFEPAIDALCAVLEQRDQAYEDYLEDGARTVVEKTSDRGAVNLAKNPRLQVWMDLNAQALSYWRDLGLTPAGLKKIDEAAMKKPKRSALAEALKELG